MKKLLKKNTKNQRNNDLNEFYNAYLLYHPNRDYDL